MNEEDSKQRGGPQIGGMPAFHLEGRQRLSHTVIATPRREAICGYPQTKLITHRYAEPVEIARTIVFVASPIAGFMTGATVDINGGRVLR